MARNSLLADWAGYITSGTIGSEVTFPAGHVLQVVQNESTETNALTTNFVNYYEVSIQLKSASSDIYGFFLFHYKLVASAGIGVKVYRNNSATVTTSHTAVWTKNPTTVGGAPYSLYAAGGTTFGIGIINPKDALSGFSTGNTLYYGLLARKYGTEEAKLGADDNEDGWISSTLMEVQK